MISAELKLRPIAASTDRKKPLDLKPFTVPERFGLLLVMHWRDDPMVVRCHVIDDDGKVMDVVDIETTVVADHVMERVQELMVQMEGQGLHTTFNRLAHWLFDTLSTEFPRHFNSIVRVEQHCNEWNSMLHDYKESVRVIADVGKLKKIPTLLEQSITSNSTYLADAFNPHNVTLAMIGTTSPTDIMVHLLGGEN